MWGNQVKLDPKKLSKTSHELKQAYVRIAEAASMTEPFNIHVYEDMDFEGAVATFKPATEAERSTGARGKLEIFSGWGVNRALFKGGHRDFGEAYTVLAHEMAHLVLGHAFTGKATLQQEIQADQMAGCVVGWLGASLDDTLSVYKARKMEGYVADGKEQERNNVPAHAVDNHPGYDERVRIVEQGWTLGNRKANAWAKKSWPPEYRENRQQPTAPPEHQAEKEKGLRGMPSCLADVTNKFPILK